uniref:NADH dehydrogenase subunit 2 n=1 Tax=Bulinus truncatus TaxID=55810 RepID=UPI001EDD3745|nr:NADH dehydrogenase subunit 2 [Bulinus truncatus]QYJ56640.1 NADH dehydrogenase subunit 2 [Bulinus truncatus]
MNSSSLLFLLMVFLSPFISLSSSDWVVAWAGMEIGMIGVFPLILGYFSSSSKEASMKYFLIQSLASSLMLVGGILFFSFFFYKSLFLFLMGLSLKIGFFPGQFWVPSLMNSLSWSSNFLILGPLKIAPLGFLSLIMISSYMVDLILALGVMSALIGSILGVNQSSVRGMLGASSISHSGWMLVSMVYGFLWGYFMSYFIVLMFSLYSLFSMNNLFSSMNLFSMSGLPTFMMFMAKFKVLYYLILSNKYIMIIFLVFSSVISLTFYLKYFYLYLLNTKKNSTVAIAIFSLYNLMGIMMLLLV